MNKNNQNTPSRLIVEITDHCTFRCLHCFANKQDKESDWTKWSYVFSQAIKDGIESVSITGGEPLLYKNLFKLMESVDFSKTKFTIDSNCSLVDKSIAIQIKKYFKLIRPTIFGYGSDYQYNSQNSFFNYKDLLRKLAIFEEIGLPYQINIPMFGNSIEHIDEIMTDLSCKKPYEIVFIPLIISGESICLTSNDLPDEKIIEEKYDKYRKQFGNKLRLFRWAEGKHFLVRSDGQTYLHPFAKLPNNSLLLGNVFNESIPQLWQNVDLKYQEINHLFTPSLDNL